MSIPRHSINGSRRGKSRIIEPPVKKKHDPLARFRNQVEQLSQSQQELSEERVKVVEERESCVLQGKQVREQRMKTSVAEVGLMDAFRHAFNNAGFLMPHYVIDAFQRVQEERDKLGPMDHDLLEASDNLGGSEWTLLENEDRLYQLDLHDLLLEDFPSGDDLAQDEENDSRFHPETVLFESSPAVRYQAAVAELRQLVVRFDRLRRQAAELAEEREPFNTDILPNTDVIQDLSDLTESPSILLDAITAAQVRVQHLRQEILEGSGHTHVRSRRRSDPPPLTKRKLSIESIYRAQSDGSIPDVLDNPPVEQRVKDWLEEVLESNWSVYKRAYLDNLETARERQGLIDPDFDPWETRAPQISPSPRALSLSPGNHWSFPEMDLATEQDPLYLQPTGSRRSLPDFSPTPLTLPAKASFSDRVPSSSLLANLAFEISRPSTQSSRTIPGMPEGLNLEGFPFVTTPPGINTGISIQEPMLDVPGDQPMATGDGTVPSSTEILSSTTLQVINEPCERKIDSCQGSQAEALSRSPSFQGVPGHPESESPVSPAVVVEQLYSQPALSQDHAGEEPPIVTVPTLTLEGVDHPETFSSTIQYEAAKGDEILSFTPRQKDVTSQITDRGRLHAPFRPRSHSSQSRPRSIISAGDTLWKYGSNILQIPHKRWKSTSDLPSDLTMRVCG